MAADKDTIYVDIDDEITGIIDKVKGSKSKVVALVLPKRAGVFQSVVNMKLLKRAADESNKNLALITTEAGLMPLAGAAGIHVAKTLTSKPEIPPGPEEFDEGDAAIDEDTATELPEEEPPVDPNKPVGELAVAGAAGAAAADGVETMELPDDDPVTGDDAGKKAAPGGAAGAAAAKKAGKAKDKSKKIPNFNRFRKGLIIGGAILAALLVFAIYMTFAGNKATITVKTDSTKLDTSLDLNLSTTAKNMDPDTGTVPAKLSQIQKTYTQQVPTTGQKNNGNKASGTVTLTNCSKSDDISIPAGAGLSSGGNTYITQQGVTVPASDFNKGNCQKNQHANVNVIAQSPGSAYNGATTFSYNSDVSGTAASSISGGTDSIVQTVNQNDITNAKNKISANDAVAKKTLVDQLKKDKKYPVEATFVAGTPNVTTSSPVGAVASNVTVTETITYTMFGTNKKDLQTLIKDSIEDQIDTSKQVILDDGLDKAVFNINGQTPTAAQLTMSSAVAVGPDLNVDGVREAAAGKKAGAIKDELKNNPDVTDVTVKISPPWRTTAPKNTKRIKVEIAKPSDSTKASNSDDDNP